jgi:hypothetical protein
VSRASLLLSLAVALMACRGRRPTPPTEDVSSLRNVADHPVAQPETADASPAPTTPPTPAAPWCWRPKPLVDVRAIDTHGAVWSVRRRLLTDETHAVTTTLPDEIPCLAGGLWSMEFARDGAAFLMADGRFYVRPGERAGFSVTPLCSDVKGAPWSRRTAGGWSFVSHRTASVEPTLMLSRAPAGDTGWYAITGLDGSTHAVVLDASDSFLSLAEGEHLIFVDRVNTVAGAVLTAQGDRFDGLTRTAAGLTAWRDDPHGRRVIVFSESPAGPFTRVEGSRPDGPPALAVMRVDLARFVAVRDTAVEVSDDRGAHFTSVLALPSNEAGITLARPSIGWLPGHRLAVAGVGGVASETCPE